MSARKAEFVPLLTAQAARLCRIERALRRGRAVTFAALLSDTRVSPATLKRDFQFMRDELGAPIHYDGTGYRLVAAWSGVSAELFKQMEAA